MTEIYSLTINRTEDKKVYDVSVKTGLVTDNELLNIAMTLINEVKQIHAVVKK